MARDSLTIAAATRPHPHETVSGDLWTVQYAADGAARIAVIDGLGHGPAANEAAQIAVQVLTAAPDLPPHLALERCQRPLAGTRGAAITIVSIDLAAQTLTFAGIGNVEGRLWQPAKEQRFLSRRGIVGVSAPTVRPTEYPLGADWLVFLYSDGIRDRFATVELPGWGGPAQALADTILAQYARATDDATVIVVAPSVLAAP